MQFHHPHAYRLQVIEALQTEIPQAWDALLAAGRCRSTHPVSQACR
jgi:hypothetical protein